VVFPYGAATETTPEDAAGSTYDVVVVGGGLAGSIIANQLSLDGQRVLILEAGPGKDLESAEYPVLRGHHQGQPLSVRVQPELQDAQGQRCQAGEA
jgi:choline dehydrogenase-like flavoprotein